MIVNWLKLKIFGPCSIFRVGQAVVVVGESLMMVVTKIHRSRKLKFALVECEWFDQGTSSTRRNLFRENTLVEFNWEAMRNIITPK